MKGGMPPESVTLLPYREGLGLGGCLFLTFSAPEKVKHRYDIKEKNLFERESEIIIPDMSYDEPGMVLTYEKYVS
jgi:hypothetical protein